MGMVMGKAMTESMEKQQEFMQETQRVMLERNIQVICKKKSKWQPEPAPNTTKQFYRILDSKSLLLVF